jgi:hypothetical protein
MQPPLFACIFGMPTFTACRAAHSSNWQPLFGQRPSGRTCGSTAARTLALLSSESCLIFCSFCLSPSPRRWLRPCPCPCTLYIRAVCAACTERCVVCILAFSFVALAVSHSVSPARRESEAARGLTRLYKPLASCMYACTSTGYGTGYYIHLLTAMSCRGFQHPDHPPPIPYAMTRSPSPSGEWSGPAP